MQHLDFRTPSSSIPGRMICSSAVLSVLDRTRDNGIRTFRLPSVYPCSADLAAFLGEGIGKSHISSCCICLEKV